MFGAVAISGPIGPRSVVCDVFGENAGGVSESSGTVAVNLEYVVTLAAPRQST